MSNRSKFYVRAVVPGVLFISFLGTNNLFLFSLTMLAAVIWCWDFWTGTANPRLYVYAVTDASNPTNVSMQVAPSATVAVALAAQDIFGLHAEMTDLDPADHL